MMDSCARLRFEQLEEKKLLAGDVTVSVVAGALVVEGDELGNQVAISSGEAPGEYLITGLDGTNVQLEGDDAIDTEIGEPGDPVVVSGVRRGVHVATFEGDDTVILEDAQIRGNVTIRTGEGSDYVRVGAIRSGPSEDGLSLEFSEATVSIGRSLLIRTGAENDSVELGGRLVEVEPVEEEGEGDGEIAPSLLVRGHTFVGLGDGQDSLIADAVHSRWGLSANGGLDDDDIQVSNSHLMFLGIRGGAGESTDTVGVQNTRARAAAIVTGNGQDSVEVTDSAFGMLGIHLGAGDDTLSIGGTSARLAVLLGGDGDGDTWNNAGDNEFNRRIVRGFEFPEPIVNDDD